MHRGGRRRAPGSTQRNGDQGRPGRPAPNQRGRPRSRHRQGGRARRRDRPQSPPSAHTGGVARNVGFPLRAPRPYEPAPSTPRGTQEAPGRGQASATASADRPPSEPGGYSTQAAASTTHQAARAAGEPGKRRRGAAQVFARRGCQSLSFGSSKCLCRRRMASPRVVASMPARRRSAARFSDAPSSRLR